MHDDDELIISHKTMLADHEKRIRDLERASAERTVKMLNFDDKFAAVLKALDALSEKVDEMKESFDEKLVQMEARINAKIQTLSTEVNERLKPLEEADGKKWRKFVWIAIGAVVTGIIGYLIGIITDGHA